MTVEILFPEVCGLLGDIGNVRYLKKCLPDAIFKETNLTSDPYFARNQVDIVYMGSMSEKIQIKLIDKLMPFRDRIDKMIDDGSIFIFTGNAPDIMFENITMNNGKTYDGLEIFPLKSKYQTLRYQDTVVGEHKDMELIGQRFQTWFSYGNNEDCGFLSVKKGVGINLESTIEGVRRNNFFGTSLLGPFLVLNPHFTEYIIKQAGVVGEEIAFKETALKAYHNKLGLFKR
jgi:CobQ-like glutamine amidotransferase family enzyme